jgi:hypothetical protein
LAQSPSSGYGAYLDAKMGRLPEAEQQEPIQEKTHDL